MTGPFRNKHVLLGVSGSIAAYKAVDVASKLTQAGAEVDVLMTYSATHFVTPLTFRSVTHRAVVDDIFNIHSPAAVEHIALAKAADLLIIAPTTAHMIAKLALGLSDDPISVTALATTAPMLIAPAMDANMWQHPAVTRNVNVLIGRGATIIGPGLGRLASGLFGWGRLAETQDILGAAAQVLGARGDLSGRNIVVSAGGTQEPVDPVRVLTNRSSGKMGYSIAEAARDRGANVVLVAAPTALEDPIGVEAVHVETAEEMRKAVLEASIHADALIMAAAVADYRPAMPKARKMKKADASELLIELERTIDVIANAPKGIIRIAFAAESDDLLDNARAKLLGKQVDMVVANDITLDEAGFGADTNKVWLIDHEGNTELPLMSKYEVGNAILDRMISLIPVPRSIEAN